MRCLLIAMVAATTAFAWKDIDIGAKGGKMFYTKEHISKPENWRRVKMVKVKAEPTDVISRVVIRDVSKGQFGGATIVNGGVGSKQVTVKLKSPSEQKGYHFVIEVYARTKGALAKVKEAKNGKAQIRQTPAPAVRRGLRKINKDKVHKKETKIRMTPKILTKKTRNVKVTAAMKTTRKPLANMKPHHYKNRPYLGKKHVESKTTKTVDGNTKRAANMVKRRIDAKENKKQDIIKKSKKQSKVTIKPKAHNKKQDEKKQRKQHQVTIKQKARTTEANYKLNERLKKYNDYEWLSNDISVNNNNDDEDDITEIIENEPKKDEENKPKQETHMHFWKPLTKLGNKSPYHEPKNIIDQKSKDRYKFPAKEIPKSKPKTSTENSILTTKAVPKQPMFNRRYFQAVTKKATKNHFAKNILTTEKQTKAINAIKHWEKVEPFKDAHESTAELENYFKDNNYKKEPQRKTIRNLSKLIYHRIKEKLLQTAKEQKNEWRQKPLKEHEDYDHENVNSQYSVNGHDPFGHRLLQDLKLQYVTANDL